MLSQRLRSAASAALSATVLMLSACGGGGGSGDQPPAGGSGSSITLAWDPPTANTDGTALSVSDLAGYRIYYGTNPNRLNEVITLTTPGLSSYVVDNLSPATYYFAMTAYTLDGIESDFSVIAKWTVN